MAAPAYSPTRARDRTQLVAPVLLALLGAGFGASVFAEGFYDVNVWGPVGIGMLALLLALVVGTPAVPRRAAGTALAALSALWLWSWLSSSWAESADQAQVAAARWAVYVATFAVLLLLMRDGRHRQLVLASTGAGVLAVAVYVTFSMLSGDGQDLFFGGRLRDPLGYPNGQAGYFLVGLWPFIALAERGRQPLLAALGMAGAFLIACLLLVGQTRGVLPAVVVSAVAMLLVVPGRGRRLWVLIAIGVGLATVAAPLLDVYQETPKGDPRGVPVSVVKSAGSAMLLGAVVVGALWGALLYVFDGPLRSLTEGSPRVRSVLPGLATAAAVAICVLGAVGAAVAIDDPAGKIEREYDQFVNLKVDKRKTQSRFFSGGGYRYDYWRVAWKQFEDEPLKGLGAGNYGSTYFTERRTSEDIRQPHSLELQTLGELGVVGGAALAVFVLSVLAGLWRNSRLAVSDDVERMVAVAAGGAFIAWLAHTSVDWLHVIPGVTGIALIAAAVLVSRWVSPARAALRDWRRIAATVAAGFVVVAAAQAVGRTATANALRVDAQEQLSSDPALALQRSNEALSLEGESMRARYVKSAAYARLGRYGQARATLHAAARLEPRNHLPWALLGDLAARRGDIAQARRDYRRALRLNPRGFQLEQLAGNPRSALRAGRD